MKLSHTCWLVWMRLEPVRVGVQWRWAAVGGIPAVNVVQPEALPHEGVCPDMDGEAHELDEKQTRVLCST